MRPGQKNRGRGGRNMMGGHPQNRQGGGRPPHRSQSFDSSGPSVKIRGNAYQVFERYIAMAREAGSAGDRIAAENLYQHAEHYYRIMQANGGFDNQGQRPMTPADNEMAGGDEMDGHGQPGQGQGQPQHHQQQQQHQSQQYQQQQHQQVPQPQHQPMPPQQHQAQHANQHQPQPQQPRPQPQPQAQPPHQPSASPAGSGAQPPMPPADPDYNA
ncbi:MAG: DUF4167 domain-containing protein [Alphaproteobacteria bacterium]|nr:DUF4167 domain-containing protein [Alphaproteobacteria bacterium]